MPVMSEFSTRPVSALPAGTTLNRYLQCLVQSGGNLYEAKQIAETMRETPQVRLAFDLMTKSAVAPGRTDDASWAQPLVVSGIAAEALSYLRGESIVAQVAGRMHQVPFGMKVPVDETAVLIGDWIVEGGPTPAAALNFDAVAPLDATKLGAIVSLTHELIMSSDPAAEATVRRSLLGGLAKTIDDAFLSPSRAAATDRPASITNGAPTVTSTGTTAAAIQADLGAMIAAITTPGAALTWIMRGKTAATIGGALGAATSGLPGSLAGLPIVVNENSPAQVTLVDLAAIVYADDGQTSISKSFEATLQLNSTPDAPPTAATVYAPIFQRNEIALKAIRWINWFRVVDGAVVYMPVAYESRPVMSHITDYHAALAQITADPLKLTPRDFAALEEHGGASDVARADDAIRHAQVQLVTSAIAAAPLITKAVSRDTRSCIAGQPPLRTKSIDRSNVPRGSSMLNFALLTPAQEWQIEEAVVACRRQARETARALARDMLADGVEEDHIRDAVDTLLGEYTDQAVARVRRWMTDRLLAGE